MYYRSVHTGPSGTCEGAASWKYSGHDYYQHLELHRGQRKGLAGKLKNLFNIFSSGVADLYSIV